MLAPYFHGRCSKGSEITTCTVTTFRGSWFVQSDAEFSVGFASYSALKLKIPAYVIRPHKVEKAKMDLVYYYINLSSVLGGKSMCEGSGKRPWHTMSSSVMVIVSCGLYASQCMCVCVRRKDCMHEDCVRKQFLRVLCNFYV